MTLVRWQPFQDMREVSDLLNRSFMRNGASRNNQKLQLNLDLYETDENLVLRAAIPGARKEDIIVELEDQILTVTAKVNRPELPEGARSVIEESAFGTVTRTLRIPRPLDLENSKGAFVDGVLEVTFPKAPDARRKSITIE